MLKDLNNFIDFMEELKVVAIYFDIKGILSLELFKESYHFEQPYHIFSLFKHNKFPF